MGDPLLFLQDLAVILISASIAGYICRRIGLSPVVGYISAGLVVGTPEIAVPYVTDEERIGIIAQLGVVFLMFSIGLQFRLRRVRELGFRILFSTLLLALMVFSAVRFSAFWIGLSIPAGIALAAVFMNSSSAIISKIIHDKNMGHERHGQLAMGTTLLEDIVAVVMLAIIGSYLVLEGDMAMHRPPLQTVGLLVGFAVMVFILGTLLVPRILRMVGAEQSAEATNIAVAGLLLFTGLLAVRAGYSLALGSFLCGMIIAETRQRPVVERGFQGLKDIFLTIFFVTIGMMVDIHAIPDAMHWILLGTVGALVGRALAGFVALTAIGEHPQTAMRAALCLTPLGEFSFIIAGVAVAGGLFGENFQVAAVGTVLGTSLISPLIAAKGQRISAFLSAKNSPALDRFHRNFASIWRPKISFAGRGGLWNLLRRRFGQIAIELLIASSLLVFADKIHGYLVYRFQDLHMEPWFDPLFMTGLAIVFLIPMVAIWRNLSAVNMIIAEYVTGRISQRKLGAGSVSTGLQLLSLMLLLIWFGNLMPGDQFGGLATLIAVVVAVILAVLMWRRLIRMHSEMEWTLDQNLRSSESGSRHVFDNWKDSDWGINLREFIVPDGAGVAGNSLKQLGIRKKTACSIVGIERHGHALKSIGPDTQIFPGDEVLLLGTDIQIQAAIDMLSTTPERMERGTETSLENLILRSLKMTADTRLAGKTLSELDWPRRYGIQVVALMRNGETSTSIDADTRIEPGDELLLLGPADRIARLAEILDNTGIGTR